MSFSFYILLRFIFNYERLQQQLNNKSLDFDSESLIMSLAILRDAHSW